MKLIAPKMKALQEQYANDKQQLQIKMRRCTRRRDQSAGRLLPISCRSRLHRAVLGAAVGRRAAAGAVDPVDPRLVGAGPYFVLPVIYAITAYCR